MKLEEIEDMQILSDIIRKVSGKEELDSKLLEKTILAVHCHTMAVALLGILIKKGDYSLQEILLKLKMRNLRSFLRRNCVLKKGTSE